MSLSVLVANRVNEDIKDRFKDYSQADLMHGNIKPEDRQYLQNLENIPQLAKDYIEKTAKCLDGFKRFINKENNYWVERAIDHVDFYRPNLMKPIYGSPRLGTFFKGSPLQDILESEENTSNKVSAYLKTLPVESRFKFLKIGDVEASTVLHRAVFLGREKTVRDIIRSLTLDQKWELLKLQDIMGRTALHVATFEGRKATVREITRSLTPDQRCVLLKMQSLKEETALHSVFRGIVYGRLSIQDGQEIIRDILDLLTPDQRWELLKVKDGGGKTVLNSAIWIDLDLVKELLDHLTETQRVELMKSQDLKGMTVFYKSVAYHVLDRIKYMIEPLSSDQRLELYKVQTEEGYTAFHLSIFNPFEEGRNEMLESLNPDQRLELLKMQDDGGDTVLHLAVQYQRSIAHPGGIHIPEKCVRELIRSVKPEERFKLITMRNNKGETAFDLARRYKQPKVIKEMLDSLNFEERMILTDSTTLIGKTALAVFCSYLLLKISNYILVAYLDGNKS
ncbi:MAG: hypothetical protein K1060chlam5_00017 [Candidatus Anoxychlamydiales bacterium]|nr:hypothetical protein [Candidatus Anoxychlamydiales bacterium]